MQGIARVNITRNPYPTGTHKRRTAKEWCCVSSSSTNIQKQLCNHMQTSLGRLGIASPYLGENGEAWGKRGREWGRMRESGGEWGRVEESGGEGG